MELPYAAGESWPPDYPLTECAEMGHALLFEVTKRLCIDYQPKHASKIETLTEDNLLLEFLDNEGGTPRIIVGHGLLLNRDEGKTPYALPPELTSIAFQELSPQLRIHVARAMVWSYIFDILDEQDGEEDRNEEADDDTDKSFDVSKLHFWNDDSDACIETEDIEPNDPTHLMVANKHPELRTLFYGLLEGQIRYND